MMTTSPWFQHQQELHAYFHTLLQKVQLTPVLDKSPEQTVFWINLAIPAQENVLVSLSIHGHILQLRAHNAITGEPTNQTLENINQVNLAPWGGRAYIESDNQGVGVAIGIPLPPAPDPQFPIDFYFHIIANSVCQLRARELPDTYGPPVSSMDSLIKAHLQWATASGVAFSQLHQGRFLVMDTYSPAGHEVRLELFVVNDRLSAARVHAAVNITDTQSCLQALVHINKTSAAGALGWDQQTGHLAATTILYPAVSAVDQQALSWLVQQSLSVFDRGWEKFSLEPDPSPQWVKYAPRI